MRSLFGNLHPSSGLSPLTGGPAGAPAGRHAAVWWLVCLTAGGLQALSLAWPLSAWSPPGVAPGQPSGWLQIASLALLVLALRHSGGGAQAFWRGWLFAVCWMAGTFWWLFVSMHTYGGLAAWMAVLAVFALAAFLAVFYGLATWALCRWAPRSRLAQAGLFAALWTLAELMRGQWLTGLPWGAGGYAQVDLMAAWAPWVGVYGMGGVAAFLAYVAGALLPAGGRPRVTGGSMAGALLSVGVVALVLASILLGPRWQAVGQRDTADTGPLSVWLLQGNIPQNEKFETGTGVALALGWYPAQITEAARARRAGAGPDLVVAPETAVPVLPQQLGPEFWEPLFEVIAASTPTDGAGIGVLTGIPLGSMDRGYTNSVWGMSAAMLEGRDGGFPGARFYRYSKHHLVPFGEFIPPLFRWFTDMMHIPLGDFARGPLPQAPWSWAGQRVAPNICYEDLFGEEIAAAFAEPGAEPTVLVNVSNIGWFGDTVAIDQHLQISRMRALEMGRPMLRATNTGATAVIDHRGVVTHSLPRLIRGRLEAQVRGRSGRTPYASWASQWGMLPLWALCLGGVMLAIVAQRAGATERSRP